MKNELIGAAILWSGWTHLALSGGSMLIPVLMQWKRDLATLKPLLRQMFWTYAAYILGINITFGLISIGGVGELSNGSFLAKAMTLFIGLYWFFRLLIQLFYFDRSAAPSGLIFRLGELALVALFTLFSVVYLTAFLYNLKYL